MKYNFVKTSDVGTKDKLLAAGFTLVSQDGNVFTFLNDARMTFDNKTMQYSNMLSI